MKEIVSNLKTVIVESEDGKRRLSLSKIWDGSKPSLAIVMICPSSSGEVAVDTSTALTMANSYRLGYGSVTILNLFSEVNNFELKGVEDTDEENIKAIVAAAEKSDSIVLAWGNGRMKNKDFQRRVEHVLTALRPFEKKWQVICDAKGGSRGSHPLAPRARQWHLSSASLSDFKDIAIEEVLPKKKGKGKASNKPTAE